MSNNGGDVAWRYRWGGWGLARTHTDKAGWVLVGGGNELEQERETGALLSLR